MKKNLLLVILLVLVSASVQAITVEKWTLQGVASYAQALVAAIATGTGTSSGDSVSLQGSPVSTATPSTDQVLSWNGSAWEPKNPLDPDTGWISGNATDQYSIPIWDSTTNTWTARPMLPVGISAASSKQPLSITVSGTLQYLIPGGEPVSILPSFATPTSENGFHFAEMYVCATNTIGAYTPDYSGQDTYIRHAFDSDSNTYCRIMVYEDLSEFFTNAYISVDTDRAGPYLGDYYGFAVNGYSFQIASTTTYGASSWVFEAFQTDLLSWVTLDSVTATSTIGAGQWYTSTASFSTTVDGIGRTNTHSFRLRMTPASGSYLDIAEFQLLRNPASSAHWANTQPPASFAVQTVTFSPSSSVPTATGSVFTDTGGVLRVRDQHGATSPILTDYPRWNDLRVPLLSTNAGGTNAPTPVVVKVKGGSQGVFAFQFSATTEQELYCSVQLPHELYKTHAHPHVHWITPTPAANATAVWGIEYLIANVNATYPAATTIATAAGGAGNVAFKHVLTELPEIDLSQAKDSSVLLVRFFRDATNASDTLGACWASDFDLHVQIRDRGSLLEYGDN